MIKKILSVAMVMALTLGIMNTSIHSASAATTDLPYEQNIQAEELQAQNPEVQHVAPIIIWAAGVLGVWLGEKLLNYGAKKFCAEYRNYNAATKKVCKVIA
ncbi:hypothetical protein H0911_20925 [Bacillus sp. HSTU-bmb18]|uniref:hypothetical protein n=1 Tax=Bacillus sp. HSTU-bmb18 TaxID=2755318 RepID=UPI0034C645D4|nr:hypothetical protein [Bacillus cereus]